MPLQNRVTPFADLIFSPARGLLMGNRGGRLHDAQRKLGARRWASKQWICCKLAFNDRHRAVWGDSYSELFFLDEPTALASGHRPCFECRHAAAQAYRRAFAPNGAPKAAEMDLVLHRERLAHFAGRFEEAQLAELPDGAMVERAGRPYAVRGNRLLPWSFFGYGVPEARSAERVRLLTPRASVAALADGYRPLWADAFDNGMEPQ